MSTAYKSVAAYEKAYCLRDCLPLTRVLTIDKVTGSGAHKGLGQIHMLRNGMCWKLLEDQLVHSQPQNGMRGRLQAAASFACEVRDEEVQTPLPTHDVGD